MTRVYLPASLRLLDVLWRQGSAPLGQDAVVAVDDSEDAEYDALTAAAAASGERVAELAAGERRRVVVVAEVATPAGTVDLGDVVAVHADAADLPPDLDPEDRDDLGWYATQEIPDLLDGWSPSG